VTRAVHSACGADTAEATIGDRLGALVARGVVISDNGRFLSLAVPLGEYVPAPAVIAHFYRLLATEGRRDARGVVIACRDSTRRRDAVAPHRRGTARRSRTGPSRPRHRGLKPEQFLVTPNGELVVRSIRPANERRA
jgi:hypothetical protein